MKTRSSSAKKALVVTFDTIRETDPAKPLAAAYLLAYLKNCPEYGTEFTVDYLRINILAKGNKRTPVNFDEHFEGFTLNTFNTIALGAYVWGDSHINPCISYLRSNGFTGKIVLGGNQIPSATKTTNATIAELEAFYPGADIFITGYAEESLRKAIRCSKPEKPDLLSERVATGSIPSPFLSGEIEVYDNMPMVRMMTKRGCLYKCDYCAHKDLIKGEVYDHNFNNALLELELFRKKNVKRINVLDPVFNSGKTYLPFLRAIKELQFTSTEFTLQTRLELIRGEEGEEFLDLVQATGAHLEVGVQSINKAEYREIGRVNNINLLKTAFEKLNTRKISYEASIIYGLPNQTVSSFAESIHFLKQNNCSVIHAYPLMLLRGTELEAKKHNWNLVEEITEPYGIPAVVSSNSFNRRQWEEMKYIADSLNNQEVAPGRLL